MEPQSVFPDGARLSATITFISGYASALVDQRNRADAPQIEKLEEQFAAVIELCKQAPEHLPISTIGATEQAVRTHLAVAVLLVEGLKILRSVRPGFLEKNPEAKKFWNDDAQEVLEDTLELFDEQAETLALGLSAAFHDEIDSARKEAGIDPDAKASLPTR